ncbi:MAG: GDP-L-fucose synthase [Hyphomicrobium sp.]
MTLELRKVDYRISGTRGCVAGPRGMVGSAVMRRLATENCDLITAPRDRIDFRDQAAVRAFLSDTKPDAVILAAARVGGIFANNAYPADFLYDNLAIEANLIEGAFRTGVEKLVFLGSSCIYPKHAPQPMREDALLTGPLEPTNEWYAIAKIAGLKLCAAYRRQHGVDYISAMPTNLYGRGDNFNAESSHVIPALIRKAHEAKLAGQSGIRIWGTGTPRREFLHVDNAADAIVHLLKTYSGDSHVNVGFGADVTIRELAQSVCAAAGLAGAVETDPSKPDGTPQKLLDSSLLFATGWHPTIDLKQGLADTYAWYCDQLAGDGAVRS